MHNHGKTFLWSAVVLLLLYTCPHCHFASLSCQPCLLFCHRLPSGALWQIAMFPMHALCPLPSTLCPLPHVACLVWSCRVLASFCVRHLLCFCALFCYLLPCVALWQFALCPAHAFCHLPSASPLSIDASRVQQLALNVTPLARNLGCSKVCF